MPFYTEKEQEEMERRQMVRDMPEKNLENYVKEYWGIDTIPEEGDFLEKFSGEQTEYLKAAWVAVQKADGAVDWIKRKGKGWGASGDMSEESIEMECRIGKYNEKEDDLSAYYYRWLMTQIESVIKNGWLRHLALMEKSNK